MHSGAIPDGRFSIIMLDLWRLGDPRHDKSTDGSTISFDVNVSSQSIGDKLTLSIGGNFKKNWSGNVGWQRVSFEILGSRPTFVEWEYRKDGSISAGSDSAWIRRVVIE